MLSYILGLLALLHLHAHVRYFLIKRRSQVPVPGMRGAEPIFLKRGKVGVLFIHGFTSSPHEGKYLGVYLAGRNITFSAPLLPGHGTSPEKLAVTKWDDWLLACKHALVQLELECSSVVIIGSSMGGNLALLLAAGSHKVRGLVSLGTPMFFPRERLGKLMYVILNQFKLFQSKHYPKVYENVLRRRVAYTSIPLVSLGQFLRVVDHSKAVLRNVRVPILVMQSTTDHVIRQDSAQYVMDNVGSKKKELVWIPDSYHVFIVDKFRGLAFRKICTFVKQVA